ncbi:MAG: isoprenylcysteine carboxylmethyltransferase family protein [Candidatus Diapherotrites archaeon]
MPKKGLLLNAALKLAGALVFMVALLFWVAGTYEWLEAWLYIILMFAAFIPMIFYFMKHSPEMLERREMLMPERGWDIVIVGIASVLMLSIFPLAALDFRFGWWQLTLLDKALGFAGLVFSYILLFLVMRENAFLFRIVKIAKGHKVVSTGPYAYVRHPMYVSVIVMIICTALLLGSGWALIISLLSSAIIVARTVKEDTALQRELPGYREYAKKTPYKIVPGIW